MGFLVVIEGIDGSGKGTQTKAVTASLRTNKQMSVGSMGFPRYARTEYGKMIGKFLNGDFGTLKDVHPILAAALYAGDRAVSLPHLEQLLCHNDVVILDRYVPSNMAHQSVKAKPHAHGMSPDMVAESIERLEYHDNQLPRPDMVILLDITVDRSKELVSKKAKREYTDEKADIQEAATDYMIHVREWYLQAAKRHNWSIVSVVSKDGDIRPETEITEEITKLIFTAWMQKVLQKSQPPVAISGRPVAEVVIDHDKILQSIRDTYHNAHVD